MDIKQAILYRSSTRQFLDQPVKDSDLISIIRTAQKAPSWINAQEIHLYVAEGHLLNQMRKKHQAINDDPDLHTKSDVPYVSIRDWDQFSQKNMNNKIKYTHDKFGTKKFNQMNHDHSDQLFNAPAVVYLTLPKGYAQWSLIDTGLLAQTIMLSAQDKGVDSIPAFEFVKYPNQIRKFMKIPKDQKVILGIGLGYKDQSDPINTIHPKRVPVKQVLKIEK